MTVICAFIAAPASADLISFLNEDGFAGVDDSTGWSTTDATVNLGTSSESLLDGDAWVFAFVNGFPGSLTHRGTRGLGIGGGDETDELDSSWCRVESIEITFPEMDHYVNSLEVRSLYTGEGWFGCFPERGIVDLYLDDEIVHSQGLVAAEGGGDGVLAIDLDAILADRLVFYVPKNKYYTSYSEFAVARLDVTPVPIPGAVLLGMLGLSVVGIKLRKYA